MKLKSFLFKINCFLVLLFASACSTEVGDKIPADTSNPDYSDGYVDTGDDELIPNSQNITIDNTVIIDFYEAGVEVINPFEGSGVSIKTSGAHVVVTATITDKVINYVLSGITSNGSFKIYGKYDQGIILNGVGITNPGGAAINNQCFESTRLTIINNTNNRLIDAATYSYTSGEDMKGTFFSEGSMEIYGFGTLEIRGKNKHAICVDNMFYMYEGNIWIKEAASDAIHANDYIYIYGGSLLARSAGEGLDCEKGEVKIMGGKLDITTTDTKGHGVKSNGNLYITSGEVDITVLGGASKCFRSGGNMTVSGGIFNLITKGSAYYDSEENDISSCAGIKCDGNLLIEGGDIIINSSGAGGKGINVTGTFIMNNGTVSITTTGEQYVYNRFDTAAKALKSTGNMTVNDGTILINTSGYEAEGMESKAGLYINGGNIEITAYDDCINASAHIEFTGGNVYCYSITNDGVDSNGTLTISGGVIVSIGSSSPEDGFDCDHNRFSITGGLIVGTGGSTSTPTVNACTQYSLIYSTSSVPQIIHIESGNGEDILTFKLPRTYSQMTLLFSSPLLEKGIPYTIYTGGNISGGTNFHGLYTDASYASGTIATTFTPSSMVTTIGSSVGGGNPGGGRPW